jgi:hypothetical protein
VGDIPHSREPLPRRPGVWFGTKKSLTVDRAIRIGLSSFVFAAAVLGGFGWFFIAAGSALLVAICLEAGSVSRSPTVWRLGPVETRP